MSDSKIEELVSKLTSVQSQAVETAIIEALLTGRCVVEYTYDNDAKEIKAEVRDE